MLLRVAKLRQHADRAKVAGLHHIRAAGANSSHLLDRNHRVCQRATQATLHFGDGDA